MTATGHTGMSTTRSAEPPGETSAGSALFGTNSGCVGSSGDADGATDVELERTATGLGGVSTTRSAGPPGETAGFALFSTNAGFVRLSEDARVTDVVLATISTGPNGVSTIFTAARQDETPAGVELFGTNVGFVRSSGDDSGVMWRRADQCPDSSRRWPQPQSLVSSGDWSHQFRVTFRQ